MLINLSELFISKGKEKFYSIDIEMKQFHAPEGVYQVVDVTPVSLRIINVGDRTLFVEGKTSLSLMIPCGRCLDPVKTDFKLHIETSLDMKKSDEDRLEDLDERPYVNGYNLDVDRLVQNELLLNLPMKVLCDEDCKGICNRCGVNLNYESCECGKTSPDPRMSVIQDIFNQFKEV